MRVATLLVLTFLLSPVTHTAQTLPEWYRVYTLEDSFIEMNTQRVLADNDGGFRVIFRWSFDEPETLGGQSPVRYKTRLEAFQLDCPAQRYRLREVTLLDAKGIAIAFDGRNIDDDWKPIAPGSASTAERLFVPACRLIESKLRPPSVLVPEVIERESAAKFARAFAERLERANSLAPLIEEFFAPDYLNGYLQDRDAKWLLPLERHTAAKATREELRKFHTALLNAAYLGGSYIISRHSPKSDEDTRAERELIPPDVIRLIERHPYTAAYRGQTKGYDYLAQTIDSVERLRSYTDLLERIGALLRKHGVKAVQYKEQRVSWEKSFEVIPPGTRVCATGCLGLPAGTKLFQVNVPVFQLQLAEINGELKIVSIGPYSR